jgi:hypothetical protein
MSIAEMLFNAASGGILGSALHCVTDYFDTKNKVTLLNAQIDAASKAEAWRAFSESQRTNEAASIPDNVPAWVGSLYLCVDAFRQLTRPILTWAAVGIISGVYATATPPSREAMQSEILFGSFTAIFWWFGARYTSKR